MGGRRPTSDQRLTSRELSSRETSRELSSRERWRAADHQLPGDSAGICGIDRRSVRVAECGSADDGLSDEADRIDSPVGELTSSLLSSELPSTPENCVSVVTRRDTCSRSPPAASAE